MSSAVFNLTLVQSRFLFTDIHKTGSNLWGGGDIPETRVQGLQRRYSLLALTYSKSYIQRIIYTQRG